MPYSETKAAEDGLLDRVYHLAGGDTHKAVNLQGAGRELGLSCEQMMLVLCSLVEQGYLLPSEEPNRMALYLTDKAMKKMASVQTRR